MQVVNAVKHLITDVNLQITKRHYADNRYNAGVSIKSMDLSHVSLVSAEMSMEAFSTFGLECPSYQLGINLNHLSKVLACAQDDDRVVLLHNETTDPGNSWVHIHMYSCGDEQTDSMIYMRREINSQHMKSKIKDPIQEKYFTFPTILVDEVAIGVPAYPAVCTVSMPSRMLFEMTEELSAFSDTLDICVTVAEKNQGYIVTYSALNASDSIGKHDLIVEQGNTQGDVSVVVHTGNAPDIEEVKELITLSFASKYLQYFAKSHYLCETVEIHLRDDAPIEIRYKDSYTCVSYHLAPRIAD